MNSLASLLYKVLDIFANNSVRNFMTSFGVGLTSGAAIYLLVSNYIDRVIAQADTVPYLSLLSLFGIDAALSIILGAILTRVTFAASKVSFSKVR
ncbi:DUF2523 family protein [Acinetobacter haemolyticus]|uniref:DUF2523 family protein n=1 Tax=Acinetobacter haemolyticus TaxID=29430 RepID=UPI0013730C07|nr:DUF2523 family protein [Acinetobacter haemolyticus]NAS10261.1 DUF2523 domain-containing protein [Acinetobacter haemolyticus]